jgi:hypothetical protein
MGSFLASIALLLLSVPLVLAIVRANELFVLKIEGGSVRLARGRIPKRLLDDLGDVVRGVAAATLRCVNESGKPTLYAEGDLDPVHRQRVRNLVGTYTVSQIRAGVGKRRT